MGSRIKALRKKAGLTLNEVSKKSGVALATLSRMENGKMVGTLESHRAVCKALNASVTDLYKAIEEDSKTVEKIQLEERAEHFSSQKGVKYELLVSKPLAKNILPLMLTVIPGGGTKKEHTKPGVEKFIHVLKGSLEVSAGGKDYSLKAGDSLYFDSSLTHSLSNTGKVTAEAICFIAPPSSVS